ncbi:MAG: ribosome small subunit-dependent GTPase A [Cellvibrionales bacterium]|nr:ribosome small subunit-dependent GTPase A [Cellvibrionales bacterium]
MSHYASLQALGWRPFFQQQLDLNELETLSPCRIMAQHKSRLLGQTESDIVDIPILPSLPDCVVGDWVLLNAEQGFVRLLERASCFKRKAAGDKAGIQLIAANVDTAFIVTSLNDDFNLNRLERYLALAHEAGVEPVVVLSKSDLVESSDECVHQIHQLDSRLSVEAINSLDNDSIMPLKHWFQTGQTIILLGSSGVGKSTLTNTLLGENKQATQGIREDDAKGRHTTTSRSLMITQTGGLILDTPGMRELQLADAAEGLAQTFSDIEELAKHCQFTDCQHGLEPGCAVQEALSKGELDSRRFENYQKLCREEQINTRTLAEKRAKDKAFGKTVKRALKDSHKLKGR